jgi:hypothetical protein
VAVVLVKNLNSLNRIRHRVIDKINCCKSAKNNPIGQALLHWHHAIPAPNIKIPEIALDD